MIFLVVLAVGLLTVPLTGGRFSAVAELPLRRSWVLAAALLLQILTISVLTNPPHQLAAGLHLLSYALAGAFLWANRRLTGLPLAAAGGALNALAIAANSGTMPATATALRAAGITQDGDHFANSTTVAHPHLALLGDIFAVPAAAGPLANVFSIGDLILTAGVLWLIHAAAHCPRTTPRPAPALPSQHPRSAAQRVP